MSQKSFEWTIVQKMYHTESIKQGPLNQMPVKPPKKDRAMVSSRYEGWGAVALLEPTLLQQLVGCARASADAYAWLHVRAQSDTGVGRVLFCFRVNQKGLQLLSKSSKAIPLDTIFRLGS